MKNFNETINSETGHVIFDRDYVIYRVGSTRVFELLVDSDLLFRKNAYRLFIQYKTMAGRCFMWDGTEETRNGIELRSINDASKDDCEGFGNPRFDGMESAIFITDRYVVAYGNAWIEAYDISKDKKHVDCTVSLCGYIVSCFRIPAEVFDRLFGLKENFPKQYEKVFEKTEDAKPVQEENDLIEEAKRNVEWCKNSLITNKYRLEKAVYLIQGALEDFDGKWHELDDMLYKLTQKEERRDVKK